MAQPNSVSETIFCSAQLKNLHFYEEEKETTGKQHKEREVKEQSIYGIAMTMMMKRNEASEKVEQKEIK